MNIRLLLNTVLKWDKIFIDWLAVKYSRRVCVSANIHHKTNTISTNNKQKPCEKLIQINLLIKTTNVDEMETTKTTTTTTKVEATNLIRLENSQC